MKDKCDHGCHGQLLCCMRGRFRSRVHRPIVVFHEMDVTVSCAHACLGYVSLHVSASARKTKALTSAFESKIVEALFTPRRLFEVEELRFVALVASDCRCSRSFIYLFYVFRPLCESAAAGRFFMSSAAIAMASTTFLAAVFGLASSLVAALGSFSSSIKLGNFRLRRFFGRKAREQ